MSDAVVHAIALAQTLETLQRYKPEPVNSGYLLVNKPEIGRAIATFVDHFGFLAVNIFDDGPRRRCENAKTYQARRERLSVIDELFSGIDLAIFRDRTVRNRYIHYEEHLAKYLLREPPMSVMADLGFSHRDIVKCKDGIVYIRVYEFDTDTLLHLGCEFDMRALYAASMAIATRIKELGLINDRHQELE